MITNRIFQYLRSKIYDVGITHFSDNQYGLHKNTRLFLTIETNGIFCKIEVGTPWRHMSYSDPNLFAF